MSLCEHSVDRDNSVSPEFPSSSTTTTNVTFTDCLIENADVVVMLQAQIGGIYFEEFVKNNIDSTKLILDLIKKFKIFILIWDNLKLGFDI